MLIFGHVLSVNIGYSNFKVEMYVLIDWGFLNSTGGNKLKDFL